MNKELKKKWVEALRSGDYQQAKGLLCRTEIDGPDSFCCLGVLCEVAKYPYIQNYDQFLPVSLQEEQGLDNYTNINAYETIAGHLMMMNDYQNKSFAEIADWIEANVPEDAEVTAQD